MCVWCYLGFLLLRLRAISLTAWGWDMTMLKPYFRQRVCDIDKGKTKRDSNKCEKLAEQN